MDPRRKASARKLAGVSFPLVVALVLLANPGQGFSAGPPNNALDGGCSCHSPSPTSGVTPFYSGLPAAEEKYEAGKPYTVSIEIRGGPPPAAGAEVQKGGFVIGASAGEFSVPAGSSLVQVEKEKVTTDGVDLLTQAKQTKVGDTHRAWNVTWTAPSPASGDVTFVLVVNAVNGNKANDNGDQWNKVKFVVKGEGGVTISNPPVPWDWILLVGMPGVLFVLIIAVYLVNSSHRPPEEE